MCYPGNAALIKQGSKSYLSRPNMCDTTLQWFRFNWRWPSFSWRGFWRHHRTNYLVIPWIGLPCTDLLISLYTSFYKCYCWPLYLDINNWECIFHLVWVSLKQSDNWSPITGLRIAYQIQRMCSTFYWARSHFIKIYMWVEHHTVYILHLLIVETLHNKCLVMCWLPNSCTQMHLSGYTLTAWCKMVANFTHLSISMGLEIFWARTWYIKPQSHKFSSCISTLIPSWLKMV